MDFSPFKKCINYSGYMSEKENIINCFYDFLVYIIPQLDKFPRRQKFLIADKIEISLLQIFDNVIAAYYSREDKKINYLTENNIILERVRFLIRLSKDLNFISVAKYGYISERLNELGKMMGGWIKSIDEKRKKSI